MARSKPPVDRELKKERLELRVVPSAKKLIQRAMDVSGLTAGDLAYEGARRVLEEHERMVLVVADRDAFLQAVLDPPAPTGQLVAALKRHRTLPGSLSSPAPAPLSAYRHRCCCCGAWIVS